MDHTDHVNLLRRGVPHPGSTWADFGSGSGAFTLALAELLGPGGIIHSVDRDTGALRTQQNEMRRRFPLVVAHYHAADYCTTLTLPQLDGLVAANTLHFHRDQASIVRLFKRYLRADGRMLVVEYNIDQGNYAVPFPLPFVTWEALAAECGFRHTELLTTRQSRFLREIYSAVSW
jgi:ubiquinone/menaquinone biosynthesis C-methylase UbiE